jgi:lysophospholipase L1-like esterase
MKKYGLIGMVLALVVVAWVVFPGKAPQITNYPPKNQKNVAFGDSLVFGYGATTGKDFVSVLAGKLDRTIVNLGKSGDTTTDGLARVDVVKKEDPGVVILLLGGNDYLRRVNEETTKQNLVTLVETFERNGAVVVLLGVRGGVLIDGREEMYRTIAEEHGAVYVEDVLSGIFGNSELMFDGIHPNDVGYARIANRLYEIFQAKKL